LPTNPTTDTKRSWTVTVEEDKETGDLMLPFPPDLLSQMGWSEGTELWWDVNDDGNIYIKKHEGEK
jgi:hypothetical protein